MRLPACRQSALITADAIAEPPRVPPPRVWRDTVRRLSLLFSRAGGGSSERRTIGPRFSSPGGAAQNLFPLWGVVFVGGAGEGGGGGKMGGSFAVRGEGRRMGAGVWGID